jgi:putative flippase GtrA
LLKTLLHRTKIGQIARYGLVGGVAALVYSSSVVILMEWVKLGSALLAGALGFVIAMIVSYLGHSLFTFRRILPIWDTLKFALVTTTSFLVSLAGMHVVVNILSWSYLVGILWTWIVVPVTNYLALRTWVFGKRQSRVR